MKLRVFFAGTGDSSLLSSDDGCDVLVDGGASADIFDDNVYPTLKQMKADGNQLDIVVVSHIDNDHIEGIIRLLDLYKAQLSSAPRSIGGEPALIPDIKALWHNTWLQAPDSGELFSWAQTREGPGAWSLSGWAQRNSGFVHGVGRAPQAVDTSNRAREIPSIARNPEFPNGFVALEDPVRSQQFGSSLQLEVLGPDSDSLAALHTLFERYYAKEGHPVARVLRAVRRVAATGSLRTPPADHQLVRDRSLVNAFGPRAGVSVANRSSIIVLATESDGKGRRPRTCLLTGDATVPGILGGLHVAQLPRDGSLFHCDILKVQHHAAGANFEKPFQDRVIADHYVISADGQNDNPEPDVLSDLIGSRKDHSDQPFTVWFTCATEQAPPRNRDRMRAALNTAIAAARAANARAHHATVRILKPGQHFFDICLCSTQACGCVPADDTTTPIQ